VAAEVLMLFSLAIGDARSELFTMIFMMTASIETISWKIDLLERNSLLVSGEWAAAVCFSAGLTEARLLDNIQQITIQLCLHIELLKALQNNRQTEAAGINR
jgi:hypothetical protein